MADIVINPSLGKIDFFTVKGEQVTNSMRLIDASTILFTGPLSASAISTGGGGAFVTSVQPTSNYLSKFTGNSTIANSLVYDNGTNVGIGTTSPIFKFQVVGSAYVNNGTLYIDSGNSLTWGNSTQSILGTNDVGLYFTAGSATRLFISSSGNIGIGTTTTAARLHVNSTTSGATVLRTDGTNGTLFSVVDDLSDSLMSVNNSAGLPVLEVFADDRIVGGQYGQNDFVVVNNKIGIGTNNPTAKLQITSSTSTPSAAFLGGNVGIGTTSPSSTKLHIVGDWASGHSTVKVQGITDNTTGYGFYDTAGSRLGYLAYTGAAFEWYNNANVPIIFYTNTSEKMRIASGGNVGIGTTSPSSKLHIDDATAPWITISRSGTPTWQLRNNYPSNQYGFSFNNTTAGTVPLFIGAGGNIGIGLDSPSVKLDIASTQGDGIVMRYDTSTAYQAWIRPYWNSGTDTRIDFAINRSANVTPTVIMSVGYGSNVGIGTTAPAYKLDVVSGSMRAATGAYAGELYFGTVDNENVYLKRDNNYDLSLVQNAASGNALYLASAGNVYISIDSNNNGTTDAFIVQNNSVKSGTELFRVNESGCVGIGTSSPSAKFEIGAGSNNVVVAKLTQGYERVRYYGFDLLGYNDGTLWMIGNNASNGLILGSSWDWDYQVGIYYTPGTAGAAGGTLEIGQLTKNNANYTHGNTRFYTNGIERMRITSNGRIGIGASSPETLLQVGGETLINYTNAILTVQGGSGYGFIRMYGNNSSVEMQIDSHSSNSNAGTVGTYTNHPVYIKTNNSTKISILAGGNVGIGTTAPSATLTVITTNDTGSRIQLGTNSTSAYMNANLVNDFIVLTAPFGANAASVSNGGAKWGIKMNGSIDNINIKSKSACIYAVSEETDTGYNRRVGLALHTSGFDLDNAERVRIKNDGNVGIGTSSPAYKLDVNGTTRSTTFTNDNITLSGGDLLFAADGGGNGFQFDYYNTKMYIGNNAGSTWYMIVQDDGNVGIGTTSPNASLHIKPATLGANGFILERYASTAKLVYAYESAADGYLEVRNGSDGIVSKLSGYASTPSYFLSNVGIGTTSPSSKLDVYTNGTSNYISNRSDGADGSIQGITFVGGIYNRAIISSVNESTNGGYLTFQTYTGGNGSEKMRITGGGSVGIGTTSPSTTFHVYGNAEVGDSTADTGFIIRHGSGSSQYGRIRFYSAATNINTIHSFPTAWQGGTFLNSSAGAMNLTGTNGITFGSWNSVDVAFASGGTNYFKGNVGIGISTPSAVLNIRASAPTSTGTVTTGTNVLIDSNTSNYITFRNTADNGTYAGLTFLDNNTGGYVVFRNYSGDVVAGSDSMIYGTYQDHIFQNGSSETINGKTETMRIKGNGNVGIGTNSPLSLLHVSKAGNSAGGTILMGVANDNTAKWSYLVSTQYNSSTYPQGFSLIGGVTNSTSNVIAIGGSIYEANPATEIQFYTYTSVSHNTGGSLRMVINTNGNVGIGTSSPADKLSIVNGNISLSDSYKLYNGSSNDSVGIYFSNTLQANIAGYSGIIFRSSATNISSQTERMRITNGGNVGIGTTSPSASLHVNSTTAGATVLRTDGTNGTLFSVVDDLSDSLMSVNNSAGLPVLEVFADDRIVAGQYGQNDFVVRNNRVGIGTNNPLAELHVTASTSIPAAVFIGDVGIGTTSPTAQSNYRFLQVNGPVSAIIETTVGGTRIGGFDSVSNALYVGTIGSFPIVFRTAVNEKMRIASDGNVGIGSSSPAAKLDIAGSNTTIALSFGNTVPNNPLFINTYGSNTGIGMDQATAGLRLAGDYSGGTNPLVDVGYYSGGTVAHANWVSRLKIINNGNVGIGTTSPSALLHVSGSSATSIIDGLRIGRGAGNISSNTTVGNNAFINNTTGTSNSAFGYQALYGNTTGSGSVAMGYGALYTNTTGRFNVAVGALSLYKNTFGYANTALGYQSLFNNATATANTAIGYRAMANTTGYILYNCAFGPFTLENAQGATFGADYNTAVGYNALQANTTGGSNVAVGYQALTVNKSGASNVAVGNNALGGNVTSAPSKCVAVGDSCMFNAGASPSNSTAVGTRALYSASGANNTAFGYSAGSAITTGTNLTVIGYNAAASSATATNEVTLGNSSVGTLRCAATTITSLSDFRDKTDINDIQIGLSFVEKLRPVTFKWDRREWYTDGNRDGSKKDSIIHAGFIAQELKQLQEEEGVEFLKLVYESNPDKLEATPGNLMIPLIKAVQELSIKVKFLENKIVELESK